MLRFSFGLEVKDHPEIVGLKLRTKRQKLALRYVLGNIWQHGTKPIYFRLRNERNLPEIYNPSGIGNKVLKSVVTALSDSKLIKLKKGVPSIVGLKRGFVRNPSYQQSSPVSSWLICYERLFL